MILLSTYTSSLIQDTIDATLNAKFEVAVTQLSDLPAPIGGIIQLANNTTYRFKGLINIGTNTIRVGTSNTLIGFDKSDDGIIYTGAGNAITCNNSSLSVVNIFLLGTGGATSQLFLINNTLADSFQIRECIIAGDTQAGSINGGNIIAINNNIHSSTLSYGWDIFGSCNKLAIDNNYFENALSEEHIHLETGSFNTVKITNNDFTINNPNVAILVDNTVVINNDGAGNIMGNTFTGNGILISGITTATLKWIIEDNGRRILNTSDTVTQKKVRSELELQQILTTDPDPTQYSYLLDAKDFILTQPINVPSGGINGGLTFFGLGNNFTTLKMTEPNTPMFTGGGNLFLNNMIITAEASGSSVFAMTSSTGFEAVEMLNVNFQNCESLGYLDGFRQGLLINGFMIGDKEGLEFRGTWSGGFRISDSRFIFTPTVGSYMFKGAVGQTFASRFVSNANSTIGSGSIGYDFTPNNFINDANFQLIEAQFNGAGIYVNGITQTNIKSLWKDNVGVDDTFQGCVFKNTTDKITDIITTGAYVELSVTNSVVENVWFSSESSSVFHARYNSSLPINIRVDLLLSLSSGANNELEIEIRKYDITNTTFVVVDNFKMTANGGTLGTRVEPITLASFARLIQNERIRIFIRNNSSSTDVSTESSSKLIISKR